jgi:hypothetical protein
METEEHMAHVLLKAYLNEATNLPCSAMLHQIRPNPTYMSRDTKINVRDTKINVARHKNQCSC